MAKSRRGKWSIDEDGDHWYQTDLESGCVCPHSKPLFRISVGGAMSYGTFTTLEDAKEYVQAKVDGTPTKLKPKPFDLNAEQEYPRNVAQMMRRLVGKETT